MPHAITSIVLKGDYNKKIATDYELIGVDLGIDLTLFFIDGHYTAYWQEKLKIKGNLETNCPEVTWFPNGKIIYHFMKIISKRDVVKYAIIMTDYFGGIGKQFANIFENEKNINLQLNTISKVLKEMGVEKGNHHDEFDAVGLGGYRVNPDYLDKYGKMTFDLGI